MIGSRNFSLEPMIVLGRSTGNLQQTHIEIFPRARAIDPPEPCRSFPTEPWISRKLRWL